MLEVVFVTVILGIVASIGAEIIANVYESYIVQRAQYRAAIKTE
ncbi:MAG: type II secretion system protein, partial [Sulfurovum sp.]|nr:type II secretion system protein [Sulfurovum sp.]